MLIVPPRRPFSEREFAALVRTRTVDELLLALEEVKTEQGAWRIYRAEQAGWKRLPVLWTAERRIEQLREAEAPGHRTRIVAAGVGLDPDGHEIH